MPDPTAELFDRLARRGHDESMRQIQGTVRFDLANGAEINHWLVAVDKGDLNVSRENRDADCVVLTSKTQFDQIATGNANATAMLLRADIVVHGNVQLLIMLERLLPGPPQARGPRRPPGKNYGDDHE